MEEVTVYRIVRYTGAPRAVRDTIMRSLPEEWRRGVDTGVGNADLPQRVAALAISTRELGLRAGDDTLIDAIEQRFTAIDHPAEERYA